MVEPVITSTDTLVHAAAVNSYDLLLLPMRRGGEYGEQQCQEEKTRPMFTCALSF
jgi:hypothetical protein